MPSLFGGIQENRVYHPKEGCKHFATVLKNWRVILLFRRNQTMKNLKASPLILGILAAAIFSAQMACAATPIWNNNSGGNWSVPGNWSTLAIPGTADDVQFGDVGVGTLNTMDTAFTINSLTYNQDNGGLHTTVLNPNTTLTINRGTTGDALVVNSQTAAVTASTQVPVTIQGAGATLNVNGTGNIVVREGFSQNNGSHMATLDLSGLDTFNAAVGRLLVGQANSGEAANRPSGTLVLAKTNVITLTGGTAPQVMVQDGAQNANGTVVSLLDLGQVTTINADNYRLGGQKGNGTVQFNPAFSNPSLVIRNHDTVSRAVQMVIGDNSFTSSGNSAVGIVDLTAGAADVLVDTAIVARGNPGPGTGSTTGTLGIGAGTFDVNTLEIGYGTATGANGVTTGTMLVNNNGIVTTNNNSSLVSTGAVVIVNTSLRLARTNGGTGAVTGTLTVNGGAVFASSIVAGGGNSTINLNAQSLLVISNNAGTLAAPIRNLNISDAAMTLPALNAGGVVAVSNLVAGGTANTINISSVPPIGSYPATFTLVSYKAGSTGNFALGSLPLTTPAYAGTLVDTGNGVIQLKLTAGPVVDLSVLWTGATDNNWDTTTLNWTSHGTPTNFFAGATPTFDDTAAQTILLLAPAISSGAVTVNNSTKAYQLTGAGNIAGASSLVKNGSQTLTIDNSGIDSFGSVTLNGGTLQIGSGDVNGEISALNITNNAALVVNRSGAMNLGSAIAGTGSLTKLGNGTLTLSGASTYTGPTTLTGGGLEIDGSLSGSGAITTAAGTVLNGVGTVGGGPVTVAGTFNPGPINGAGTFTGNDAMTFSSGSTLTFDLSGSNPSASDIVALTGGLNLNNNAVTANFLGVPQVGSAYTLFTYGGSLAGNFNPTVVGTHFTVALDTSSLGAVYLNVTGGSGANLKWTGATDSTWDSAVMNWADAVTAAPSLFYSGDNVLLDDTSPNPNLTIAAGVSVYPATITNNSTVDYSISGGGKISGTTGIVKTNPGTLTIGTANDFTGTVDIQGGVLKATNGAALGSATVGTTVEAGGTLDIGGQSLGGEAITIAGDGSAGQGALINSGGTQGTAFRSLTLSSNASVGGSGQFSINNSGGAASLSTGGQPFKLTKLGANQFGLQNLSSVDAALGDIEVQQGILEFNGSTPSMGDPSHTNIVDAGATLQFASSSVVWNKFFNLNGNGTTNTVNNNTAASTELAGPVELHGGVIFNVGGNLLTISGAISGDGSLTKNGATAMVLTGNNTYTGDTIINTGALRIGGNATIVSSNIIIAAGATLTATGRVDATFTLGANQTLSGNGVINGQLTTLAGSTISPGISGVGALTVSNAVTLGGTNSFDLDQDNKTNDVLNVNAGVTYGGTLNLTTLTSALTNGASFKLFKALSYGGSFASITPAPPGSGLTWNTAALSSGIIAVTNNGVVTAPTTNASITSVQMVGTNIVIHGTNNNVPNTSFKWVVLTSTNIALPFSSWTPVVTNSFTQGGTFDYTNPIVTTTPKLFFEVKVQ
jgi:autotransporter-associated beta strand protein